MEHSTAHFTGAKGFQLHAEAWLPEGPPKAALAIVHGLGEHCGRYTNLVNHLILKDYAIFSFDHRGHGRSGGKRGHLMHWDEYHQDVYHFLKRVHERHPDTPLFLYGHSLGSLIVIEYMMRPPSDSPRLRGAIISGAAIEPSGVASRQKITFARIMANIWPSFSVSLNISEAISRDPVVVQAYRADPYVHGKASVRFAVEGLKTVAWIKANPDKITLPILFIHGGADPLNTVEGARRFFEKIASADKKFYVYPGSYHEVHNDLDYRQVAADIETWMAERL